MMADAEGGLPPMFKRRIEFHLARKPFSFGNHEGSDFHLETLNPSAPHRPHTTPNNPTTSSGNKIEPADDASEYGLDPDLCYRFTVRRIGAGLENIGNTCYLNSVLQCLTYTEPFAGYLRSGKHKLSCHTAGFCAMCALQNHVNRALQATGRILTPKDLVVNLRCISRSFRNARQEDAHEYMVNLLESMHKCCLPSGVPSESPSAYEISLVHKIFGGRLRSQVKCTQCSYCSNKFDPFLDLSLEIMKADSVYKALSHFTAMEQLDGGQRQYQCQRCKHKVRALKQLTVHKAPYVLSIHLKRFGSHTGQKIGKSVQFSPTLDLKPFVSGSYEGNLKYTLYGVLVHSGWSTHSGHYYCFVRTSSGMWHCLDDNRVIQVSENVVLKQEAYMLFYVRDRKNIAINKSVDICKENTLLNVVRSGEKSVHGTNLKEIVQTDVRGLSSSDCSSGLTQTDELGAGLSKEFNLKNAADPKAKGLVGSESSFLPKVPQLESPSKEMVKGTSVRLSNGGTFVAEGSPDSSSSSVTSSSTIPIPTFTHGDPKVVLDTNVREDHPNEESIPILVVPRYGETERPGLGKPVPDKNIVVNEDAAEVEGVNDQLCQHKGENLTSKQIEFAVAPNGSSVLNGCNEKDAHDFHLKEVLKAKKKRLKYSKNYCAAALHFRSRYLFKTSLRVCKKKKHKKDKLGCSKVRSSSRHGMEEGSIGLGPSTSEKTNAVALGATSSRRKKKKTCLKSENNCDASVKCLKGESLDDVLDQDLSKRNHVSSAASSGSPQKKLKLTSTPKQCEATTLASSNDDKRNLMENEFWSMLPSGFGDIYVAPWEGAESLPSNNFESTSTQTLTIGYVPDEWDEEYDRGKRRKVRYSKTMYDGSNPFQEFATMKAQQKNKKVKINKSSGNQPFRI
ncbi:hypothetical protein Syun_021265 [Stephania yunnanensis]|uniref:Ubiquitin carboxyl-terminal hydrolase n=1 Tax=Stephania yunnanensis TaxID=152371 RepID=A0AAP0IGA1_9MAGN